jgi:hypothetical protein
VTHDEAVRNLKAIAKLADRGGSDPQSDHGHADDILVRYLQHNGAEEIAQAYEEARTAVGFWYA